MVIDPNVFRALYKFNINKFIQNKGINIDRKLNEYSIDKSSNRYQLDLLDKLVEHKFLKINEVEDFSSEELNYGRAKNIYIEIIKKINITRVDEVINAINRLEKYYKDARKVKDLVFRGDIRKFIELGEKKLIESVIIEDKGKVKRINLLFGEGINLGEGKHSNNYHSVEINLESNILSLRMINWGNEIDKKYLPDKNYKNILDRIKKEFSINSSARLQNTQRAVYNLVQDLNNKVLESTVKFIDEILREEVSIEVEKWGGSIVEEAKKFEPSDKEIITQAILNNFYRVKMASKHKKITDEVLKTIYKVQAYARQVKFTDDTIGEGKARSSDIKESILDTSVFYDIKARLDKEKNIKNTIVYWMNCSKHENFATSIHVDAQERFKVVFYPKSIDKEMVDYVLGQIEYYYRRPRIKKKKH